MFTIRNREILHEIYPDYGSRINWLWHLLLFSILPRSILAPLRAEIHLSCVRLRSFLRDRSKFATGKDLLVNIGAGSTGRKGWVNIDGWRQPGINIIHDCRHWLPLPDSSARGILTEHFLEHIDYVEDVPVFLSECLRVLQPGGVLRIIVPDAEQYMIAYAQPGWDSMRELRDGEFATKMEVVNEVFRGGGWRHKYAYDYETLEKVLKRAGFQVVRRVSFGTTTLSELAIDSTGHYRESLYVEATK